MLDVNYRAQKTAYKVNCPDEGRGMFVILDVSVFAAKDTGHIVGMYANVAGFGSLEWCFIDIGSVYATADVRGPDAIVRKSGSIRPKI